MIYRFLRRDFQLTSAWPPEPSRTTKFWELGVPELANSNTVTRPILATQMQNRLTHSLLFPDCILLQCVLIFVDILYNYQGYLIQFSYLTKLLNPLKMTSFLGNIRTVYPTNMNWNIWKLDSPWKIIHKFDLDERNKDKPDTTEDKFEGVEWSK